jgi:E3 ubiquitin-protein ligase RNF11
MQQQQQQQQSTRSSRRSHHRSSRSSRYMQINESNSSLSSSAVQERRHRHHHHHNNHNHNHNRFSQSLNQSFNSIMGSSTNQLSSSLPHGNSANLMSNTVHGSNGSSSQVYYLAPNVQRTADQLTEEEQIKLLKRMTLIQQLPSGSYDENKKNKECAICMIDFEVNDTIKYLPCMHTFHQSCIDQWLVRSLICPSCMEPVDAGLLSNFM